MEEKELIPVSGRWDWQHPPHWNWYLLAPLLKQGEPVQGNAFIKLNITSPRGTIFALFSEDLQNTKEIYPQHYVAGDVLEFLKRKHDSLRIFRERTLMVATARDTTMGRVGILNEGQVAVCNHVVIGLVPSEEHLLLDFLYYYFRLERTRYYLQNILGPGRESINPTLMGKAKVLVPPIGEQRRLIRRIETLTFDFKSRRAQVQRAGNETLKALAQAINATFRYTRRQNWSQVQLDDLLTVIEEKPYKLRKPGPQNGRVVYGDYLYLTEANIEPFTGRLLHPTPIANISQQVNTIQVLGQAHDIILYGNRPRKQPQTPTQLVPGLGDSRDAMEFFSAFPITMQLSGFPDKFFACHTNLLALRSRNPDTVLWRFLFWSLLADTITIAGLPLSNSSVSKTSIKRAVVPLPEPAERLQIVRHLDSIQISIQALREQQEQDLARLDELEQIILGQAFQGRL